MLAPRTLADRLDAVRATAPAGHAAPPAGDRLATLADWFDAHTEVTQGGTALVIERSVTIERACA